MPECERCEELTSYVTELENENAKLKEENAWLKVFMKTKPRQVDTSNIKLTDK